MNQQSNHHVLVAGYGPVGRVVSENLQKAGVHVTIIELNRRTVEQLTKAGRSAVYGSACDVEVLQEAGIAKASSLILTIPDQDDAISACRAARKLAPGIFIAARTNHLSKGMEATRAGADHVVVEEIVTAEAMQRAVMQRLDETTQPS